MSTNRTNPEAGWVNPGALPKGPNGRALCRKCGQEVPGGRKTFCSGACVHEWKLTTDPGYARDKVYERDRGVCAKCGRDCRRDNVPWDADHIVPVVEGGGECGLDNLRTLCHDPCHKQETALLRARRAVKRRYGPLTRQECARVNAALSNAIFADGSIVMQDPLALAVLEVELRALLAIARAGQASFGLVARSPPLRPDGFPVDLAGHEREMRLYARKIKQAGEWVTSINRKLGQIEYVLRSIRGDAGQPARGEGP